ncbi:MAG: hypothetical protein AUG06_08275 [Actinobacteria bacterium 13_1_20CM_2_65_11]|nr:MAG: hypothetical protein AUG06_08275 [Actinobacteria bacterium 13_1_20CM_2_65_11]
MIPAVKRTAAVLVVGLLIAGCGGQGASSSASPLAKPSSSPATSLPASSPGASPAPLTGAFAVLVTPPTADNYTVSIVDGNGKVVGSAQASSPTAVTCADAAGAEVPLPISMSDDRAYYMDAQGVVRFLTVQGETGRATTVPTGGGRRSTFAVSPDDQRIAVVVNDFTASGVTFKIYVEDLNGGTNHLDIYGTTGVLGLWPLGWHGPNNLVLAVVKACSQGGGPFCCGPIELHVVDPATALRRYTIGGPTCLIAGPPSAAGAVCEDTNFTRASVVNWNGVTLRTFSVPGPQPAYISPDGRSIALFNFTGAGVTTFEGSKTTLNMQTCGWIDSTHVIAGDYGQPPARIGNIVTGATTAISAKGTCAGRLPGGL